MIAMVSKIAEDEDNYTLHTLLVVAAEVEAGAGAASAVVADNTIVIEHDS